jgi:colanic acid/amylovoran biosynthesis glycosyltransferase
VRVLYVVSLFPCWSETFIVRELVALRGRGVDVRIVSLRHPSEALVQPQARALLDLVLYPARGFAGLRAALREFVRMPTVHARRLVRLSRPLLATPVVLLKSLVAWWRTLGLAERVRAIAPDHIHAHWATYPATSALVLSEALSTPFSFTAHAHDIHRADALLPEKLGSARFTATISEFNRAVLERRVPPGAQARIEVVHCGLRLEDYPWRRDEREPGALLAVGRLDPIKGFRHLVDACALLRDRGREFRCEVVGDGAERPALEARIARLRLADRVLLRGAQPEDEVKRLLGRASVFVLPSVVTADGNRDGIPVALMEAMASGLPVVSTPVSGIPEIVEAGVSGWLVPPGDARALADALEGLLADPLLRRRLAARGRTVVEERFDVEREAARLLECFRGRTDETRAAASPAESAAPPASPSLRQA